MIDRVHGRLIHTHSAFAEVSVAAILVWIGSIVTVVADLVWLIGDATIALHPHHYIVGGLLLVGLTLIVGSGLWLYRGVNRYLTKHEKHVYIRKK